MQQGAVRLLSAAVCLALAAPPAGAAPARLMAQRRRLLSYVGWVVARHGKGAQYE